MSVRSVQIHVRIREEQFLVEPRFCVRDQTDSRTLVRTAQTKDCHGIKPTRLVQLARELGICANGCCQVAVAQVPCFGCFA